MKKFIYLLLVCGMLLSCSEKEDKTSSYIGPGSEYSITFNESANTFELTESTSSLTVNGSYTTLSTGFKKLTVGSVSGGGGSGPSVGDQAYGVDIPGVVFLLKPIEDNAEIISMVSKGSCPTEDFNMNWIITGIDRDQKLTNDCEDPTGDGIDSHGTFSYVSSTTIGTLPKKFDICGVTVDTDYSLGEISCSAGIGAPEAGDSKMYLTANGGAIVKVPDNNQIIVALPVSTPTSFSDLDGDYIGLVMTNGEDTSDVFTVKSTASSEGVSGVFSFDEINPDTGDVITANDVNGDTTMTELNTPADGFSRGTFDLDAGVSGKKVTCMSNQDIAGTGKNFIFCIGQDPFAEDNMFNVLLISKG